MQNKEYKFKLFPNMWWYTYVCPKRYSIHYITQKWFASTLQQTPTNVDDESSDEELCMLPDCVPVYQISGGNLFSLFTRNERSAGKWSIVAGDWEQLVYVTYWLCQSSEQHLIVVESCEKWQELCICNEPAVKKIITFLYESFVH